MRLLVINGPNLNLLGIREKELYGDEDYRALVRFIEQTCDEEEVDVTIVQSNHEGVLVDTIQNAYGRIDGIVINPAAYTHTSIALLDALLAVRIPAVEVHLSDLSKREAYRQISYVREACAASFVGQGFAGYRQAIQFLKKHLLNPGA